MAKIADIYIPVSLYAEKNGSFTNIEGRVQSLNKAVNKDKYSDLDVLLRFYELAGLNQLKTIDEIRHSIENENPLYKGIDWECGVVKYDDVIAGDFIKYSKEKIEKSNAFILYPEASRLHSGTFTRWSDDLNNVYSEPLVNIHPDDANSLNVKDGEYVRVKCNNIIGTFKYRLMNT